jgi:hypothetical protein
MVRNIGNQIITAEGSVEYGVLSAIGAVGNAAMRHIVKRRRWSRGEG